jgi:hypothetical protein
MKRARLLLLAMRLMLLACTFPGDAQEHPQLADTSVGGEFSSTVRPGDSLTSTGARFGINAGVLARKNGLPPVTRLRVRQELRVDNRHIARPGRRTASSSTCRSACCSTSCRRWAVLRGRLSGQQAEERFTAEGFA